MYSYGPPTHGRAKAGWPAGKYIQQLCENTGCCVLFFKHYDSLIYRGKIRKKINQRNISRENGKGKKWFSLGRSKKCYGWKTRAKSSYKYYMHPHKNVNRHILAWIERERERAACSEDVWLSSKKSYILRFRWNEALDDWEIFWSALSGSLIKVLVFL